MTALVDICINSMLLPNVCMCTKESSNPDMVISKCANVLDAIELQMSSDAYFFCVPISPETPPVMQMCLGEEEGLLHFPLSSRHASEGIFL